MVKEKKQSVPDRMNYELIATVLASKGVDSMDRIFEMDRFDTDGQPLMRFTEEAEAALNKACAEAPALYARMFPGSIM